jgi:hypothetical protein
MKKLLLTSALAALATASFGQFVDGNLVIGLQSTSGTNAASIGAINKTTGAAGFTVTTTDFRFATSTAGGGLKVGINGSVYAPGSLNTSTAAPKVARVDMAGNLALAVVAGSAAPRGVAAKDDGTFFVSQITAGNGLHTGTLTFDNSTTSSLVQVGTAATARMVAARGTDAYLTRSSATASSNGVFLNGTTNQVAAVTTLASTGPSDLWLSWDGLTMFTADERTTAGVGGVVKWTRATTAANFTQQYILSTITGSALEGARFVSAEETAAGQFTIYSATAEASANRLVKIIDTGAGSAASLLMTAGATENIRGVAVVPEPASMAVLGLGLLGLARRRRNK